MWMDELRRSAAVADKAVRGARPLVLCIAIPAFAAAFITVLGAAVVVALLLALVQLLSILQRLAASFYLLRVGRAPASWNWRCLWECISARRVALLERVPGLGLPVGLLVGAVLDPFMLLTKVLRVVEALASRSRVNGDTLPVVAAGGREGSAVNALVVVKINGAEHVVRIRGCDSRAPVLLFLHGGPGASELLRGVDSGLREDLERSFLVVDYDQRGALCSGALNLAGRRVAECRRLLTVQAHIDDAAALVTHLLGACAATSSSVSLQRQKLHLCGGSWGSVLALRLAASAPHLFESPVVVRGLVTWQLRSESMAHEYVMSCMREHAAAVAESGEDAAAVRRDIAEFATLTGAPPGTFQFVGSEGIAQMVRSRGFLTAYGGQTWREFDHFQRHRRPRDPAWMLMARKGVEAFRTPEVTLPAMMAGRRCLMTTLECMADELWRGDWSTTAQPPHVGGGLSVLVAHGVADRCTNASLVQKFLDSGLTVDRGATVRLVWFAKSGHSPCKEEPLAFAALLRQVWGAAAPDPNAPSSDSQCPYQVQEVSPK